ncbi:d-alanine--d-alanine ligase a [Quercus suber]|uniref:D-alanine--d-alanine ligase a n=1 Tax=Quercus suber TaxID=58331 RepID=A0AAW0K8S6_QUESU
MASSVAYASSLALLRGRNHHNDDAAVSASSPNALFAASLNFVRLSNNYRTRSCSRSVGVPRASAEVVDDRIAEKEEQAVKKRRVLRVGIVCGGPSAERGISLNSARSVLDNIQGEDFHVSCYYIDYNLNAYAISSAQVYSNTPADFDFKLESLAQGFQSLSEFAEHLTTSVDIVFPVIHGRYGEDGGIQELLEEYNIPFVGTGSNECRQAFDKYDASLELSKQGFITVPNFLVQGNEGNESELSKWFSRNQLDPYSGKVVVKPARAGSSIGVKVAYGVLDSLTKADEIISEVELQFHGSVDITEKDAIFNYRRKYLPTQQVAYHTPPRFPIDVIETIREGASLLFQRLGLRDFARIDGWFLPNSVHMSSSSESKFGRTELGDIIFTDINLISGMEQTSFLFQQSSKVGFSHSNILRTIIYRACLRFPNLASFSSGSSHLPRRSKSAQISKAFSINESTRKVFVIFGGDTSERQVSLMSGTNVWLNLQAFDDVSFQIRGDFEEVIAACIEAIEPARAALTSQLRNKVIDNLTEGLTKHSWFTGFDIADEPPRRFSLEQWIKLAKEVQATVFIAVALYKFYWYQFLILFSVSLFLFPIEGPGVISSKTCMDKVATSLALNHLATMGVLTINKDVWRKEDLIKMPIGIWHDLTSKLQCETLCIKPARDGCSTGVARLCCAKDLEVYVKALDDCLLRIPSNCLSKAHGMIEMPNPPPDQLIFEPFIETDEIIVSSKSKNENGHRLMWKGRSRWVEITVGVIGKRGSMHSLSPSITVKETGDILSLEEKFQDITRFTGGTGINLTPPPLSIISKEALERCKQYIELIANTLQLEGFSRIDAFVNVDSGEVLIIEVNTVPGMTPSTVLIHQALSEQPPVYPHQFFRMLLDLASERST